MKNFLAILLSVFLTASFSIHAGCKKAKKSAEAPRPSNWKHIETFKQGDFYLDFESIRYNASIANFQYMYVSKEGEADVIRCSIDCKKGTIGFREPRKPTRNGATLKSKGDEDLHWIKIRPNSVWYSFQKSLCKEFVQIGAKTLAGPAPIKVERKSKLVRLIKAKPPEKPAPPKAEKKSRELTRLEAKTPIKPAPPREEKKIYGRYMEVAGMPPSAVEGLIHTAKNSRAWYEGSKISSPLTEKELQAIGDAQAKAEIQEACIIANSIFLDNPEKNITRNDLKEKGFIPSENIELTIYNGARESLRICARHNKGAIIYVADSNCNITEGVQQ